MTPLEVPSAGDVTVVAYRWDPDGEPRGVVRLAHGMGEHARRYEPVAASLTARGHVVYAHDHRGHGGTAARVSGVEPGVIGADGWRELVADLGRVGEVARAAHPGLPHALVAHSMGSFAAQQFLLDPGHGLDAVVLSGTAAIDVLEPALDLDAPLDLSAFNEPFAPARTDFDWLSRDAEQVDLYVADPWCGFGLDADGGRAMFAGARRLAEPGALAGLGADLPVLVLAGEHDPVGAGLAAVHPVVDRFTAAGLADVSLTVYPAARHEVFNETNRAEVLGDLGDWLDARLS